MENSDRSTAEIKLVLETYFNGIFFGDAKLLRSVFHTQALVAGDINGIPYFKTADQYLTGVENRKSPYESGEVLSMKIVSIEIMNSIAVAKVNVPIFEYNYYDFLSLVLIDNKWLIINKLLTHINN